MVVLSVVELRGGTLAKPRTHKCPCDSTETPNLQRGTFERPTSQCQSLMSLATKLQPLPPGSPEQGPAIRVWEL